MDIRTHLRLAAEKVTAAREILAETLGDVRIKDQRITQGQRERLAVVAEWIGEARGAVEKAGDSLLLASTEESARKLWAEIGG